MKPISREFRRSGTRRLVSILSIVIGSLAGACTSDEPTTPSSPDLNKAPANSVTIALVGPSGPSQAEDVNDAGQAVGYLGQVLVTPRKAFLWTPSQPRGTTGSRRDLGTLGGLESDAKAVTNSGYVVGGSHNSAGSFRAFLWTPSSGMQDLGTLSGASDCSASDMDEAGHVVGYCDPPEGQRAAMWSVAVSVSGAVEVLNIENLAVPPGFTQSVAFALNAMEQAVGYANPGTQPILWTRTSQGWVIERLGILPGAAFGTARGINDRGQVVGVSSPQQAGCSRAVLWTTSGGRQTGITDLGTLGGCGGEAYDINNDGDVIGWSFDAHGNQRATLWTVAADGSVLSVRNLGTPSKTIRSVGSRLSARLGGMTQVAGFGTEGNGGDLAAVWTVK